MAIFFPMIIITYIAKFSTCFSVINFEYFVALYSSLCCLEKLENVLQPIAEYDIIII